MASSVKHLCTICHDDGISNSAVTWCTECEIFFCGDCEKHHSRLPLSKNHKIMSAEDYQKLPSLMQEISSQCRDHKNKFELYCSFHASPCCVQCVTDTHKKCQDMKPLSEILKQVKSSASVQLNENDIKDVKENLDTAIKYLKTRISNINTQKTKAVEEINYLRNSINDYLNKLEEDILTDLEFKHSKLKSKMASLVQQLEQQASQIDQIQNQFTKMMKYATELQMFIGLREIEKTTSETVKYIEDLENGDHFTEKDLEVNISSAVQSILQDVKSFGDININTTSSTLQLKAGRKDQAQHLIPNVPGIEQINPSLLTKLTIPEELEPLRINACRILPDNKCIILLDGEKPQLLLFSNDGVFIRKIVTLTGDPWDVCFVQNNTVAVTLGSSNQTVLVDVEKNKHFQTFQLSHRCIGVAIDGKTLVIHGDKLCTRVNLNDMVHTILEGIEGMERIALFEGNIYGTMMGEHKVCCYKSTGEPLWTYHHEDLGYPVGLALDKNGFVYIACYGADSIVVVSPVGKTCRTIISRSDVLDSPWAIDINRETGIMIVSTRIGDKHSVLVYDICAQ